MKIVVAWSGGIDSTALLGCLLQQQRFEEITAVTMNPYARSHLHFTQREDGARRALWPHLQRIAADKSVALSREEWDVSGWNLWFSTPANGEMPRRNRYMIDLLVCRYCRPGVPEGAQDIGLGEYIGADTWVVRDHVGAADADSRALAAYLYHEWGLGYRLWTLSDFGEARYKHHRLALGINAGVPMELTTNCLKDGPIHCGQCYKCLERHAAYHMLSRTDPTTYTVDPRMSERYSLYLEQMTGRPATAPMSAFAG